MPIYEYECQACSKRIDVLQHIADPPISLCPSCGGKVRKRISVPCVHTKSKSKVTRRLLPEYPSGGLVIDATRPPTWPGGYAFGVHSPSDSKK